MVRADDDRAGAFRGPSEQGLATPISTLMIVVSLTLTASSLYYLASLRVNAQRSEIRLAAAQEKMLQIATSIDSIAWSPGSSEVVHYPNLDGLFKVEPAQRGLLLDLTIGSDRYNLLNTTIGRVVYQISDVGEDWSDSYLRGDSRTIINRSSSTMSQVYSQKGVGEELVVCYRPQVSSYAGGLVEQKRINNIRIYVVSLNSSDTVSLLDYFYVSVTCEGVFSSQTVYNTTAVPSISLAGTIDEECDSVAVPIENGPGGAQIRIELVVSAVKLREAGT